MHEIDERFRFCTECLINKQGDRLIDQDELRQKLDEIGESLIVAGSGSKTKNSYSHERSRQRIYNMSGIWWHKRRKSGWHDQATKSYANRKTTVAILTDSSADLPSEIISKFNIHVVPILINFGQQTYLDKISMTSEEFHQALKNKSTRQQLLNPALVIFIDNTNIFQRILTPLLRYIFHVALAVH